MYEFDPKWHFEVVCKLCGLGDSRSEELVYRCMDMVIKHSSVQSYFRAQLTHKFYKTNNELVLRLAIWALGHFSVQVSTADIERFLEKAAASELSDQNTSVLKIGMAHTHFRQSALDVLHKLSLHTDPEVQQRACEYCVLMTTHSHLL